MGLNDRHMYSIRNFVTLQSSPHFESDQSSSPFDLWAHFPNHPVIPPPYSPDAKTPSRIEPYSFLED